MSTELDTAIAEGGESVTVDGGSSFGVLAGAFRAGQSLEIEGVLSTYDIRFVCTMSALEANGIRQNALVTWRGYPLRVVSVVHAPRREHATIYAAHRSGA